MLQLCTWDRATVCQAADAKIFSPRVVSLRIAQLWQRDRAGLLTVYVLPRTLSAIKYRILRHRKTCARHTKCVNSILVTQTSQ